MAENEQINEEQAQKLFEESFAKVTGKEYTAAAPVVDTPALTPEPVAQGVETVVEPVEKKEATPAEPAKVEPAKAEAEKLTDPYAWLKDVPDTLREKVMQEINSKVQLEHRIKSDDGRVAAYQRKLLDAERRAASVSPPRQGAAPAERPASKTPEEWLKLAKDDPEIANAVEARVKSEVDAAVSSLESKLQELQKSDQAMYDHQSRLHVEQEREALRAAVPNYAEVIASPQYSDWLNTHASAGVREMALKSLDHRDAVSVMRQYADDMVRLGYYKPPVKEEPAAQPVQQPAVVKDTSEADRIAAERDARSKLSTVVAASTPPLGGVGAKAQFTQADAEAEFLRVWERLHKKT